MLLPPFYDNVRILNYDALDFLDISSLDALLFTKNKRLTDQIIYSKAIISLHVDMNRLMFPAVKKKEYPKNLKISGISSIITRQI